MPKLGDYRFILDTVVFIYRTREDAAAGRKAGGTGFFVSVPSERNPDTHHHLYVVTNVHVARGEPRVLRVKSRSGVSDFVTVADWVSTAGGPDVTVALVKLDPGRHVVEALQADSWLLTRDECSSLEVDAGDDVFMVGRFIDYDGDETNQPSLRFGHVSMKEARVKQTATGYDGGSFVLDMHSRTGYSGSPVFVYRTHGSIFAEAGSIVAGGHLMKLLGIHWGQFPELWELSRGTAPQQTDTDAVEAGLIMEGAYVRGLSGMTCVVPSWDIMATLNDERLLGERQRIEQQLPG